MQIHELPSGTPVDSDLIPFDTGTVNYKTPFSGFDVGENTATFTSADEDDPAQFKTVDTVETGPIKTILNRLSMAVSNVRYIWTVLSAIVSKTAIINYDSDANTFNVTYDSTHRLILNKGGAGQNELFRVDEGDANIVVNNTTGQFDLHLDAGVTHRFYLCDGSNESYDEQMVLRCGDTYLERPASGNRLNIAAPGGIFMNGNRWGIVPVSASKTTSAGGNFSYTFAKKSLVLACYCNLSDTLVIPYPVSGTGSGGATEWWFHVQSVSGSAVTSTSITAVIFSVPLE